MEAYAIDPQRDLEPVACEGAGCLVEPHSIQLLLLEEAADHGYHLNAREKLEPLLDLLAETPWWKVDSSYRVSTWSSWKQGIPKYWISLGDL